VKLGRRPGLHIAGLSSGLALLALACLLTDASPVARSWLLLAGFAALTGTLAAASVRPRWAPALIAAFFTVFGGLSAAIATREPAARLGGSTSFTYAAFATSLGGVAAVASVLAAGRYGGERLPRGVNPSADRLVRVGAILVAIGLVGLGAAVGRFALAELPSDDLWVAAKSFWAGNTWSLLIANSAVVGFGLWATGLAERKAPAVAYAVPAAPALLFVVALLPTGQRGFASELALVGAGIALARLGSRRTLAVVLIATFVPLAVITQAARNEARETGSIRVGGIAERLEPDRWSSLFGSQLASFQWTWDVAAYRDRIDAPNSFVQLPLKAVPRSILPDKSQGFSEEFTTALYPDAAADQVAFATPLVAESDYNGGLVGVAVVLSLFGLLAAFGELFVARGAPSTLRPVWAAVLIFDGFMILRGDLANAVVFGSSLTVPLVAASLALGYRPLTRRGRIALDMLQVPPELSGVGAQALRIADELGAIPGSVVEIRSASETYEALRHRLPAGATHRLAVRRSRPRLVRIAYQQVLAPLLDARSTTLICPGDQAPAWGRARVVLLVHDVRRLTVPDAPSLERAFYRLVVPRGVRRAASVLTESEFSRREIERVVGVSADRIRVLGHTVAMSIADAAPREQGPLLVVGAVRSYKGVDTVLAALTRLNEEQRPLIVVAGSTDGEPDLLRRVERLGLGRWVRVEGWVEDERLEALYGQAVGVVCPSRYEGYGLAVAESIAHGLPTIASDIPPHREIADDAALYFPPGDDQALARCLDRVADPDTRRRLADLAVRRAQVIADGQASWRAILRDAVDAR
jgi:O-antigen biosynthesis alpha-1,2-mannosyltransferase